LYSALLPEFHFPPSLDCSTICFTNLFMLFVSLPLLNFIYLFL